MREELIEELPCGDGLSEGEIALVSFAPFENGTCQMSFTVTQGARALHGVPQRLIGKYLLCGLKMRIAVGVAILGIWAVFLAAAVTADTAIIVGMRGGEQRQESSSPRGIQETPPADRA